MSYDTRSSITELLNQMKGKQQVEDICKRTSMNLDLLKPIFELSMKGYNNAQIAERIGVHRITIQRYASALRNLTESEFTKVYQYVLGGSDGEKVYKMKSQNIWNMSKRGVFDGFSLAAIMMILASSAGVYLTLSDSKSVYVGLEKINVSTGNVTKIYFNYVDCPTIEKVKKSDFILFKTEKKAIDNNYTKVDSCADVCP